MQNLTCFQKQGRERGKYLSDLTANFILRRTSKINQKYLPPKGSYPSVGDARALILFLVDTLVICKLTPLQTRIYEHICALTKAGLGRVQEEGRQTALASITHLKKLCNDPELVFDNYKVRWQWLQPEIVTNTNLGII